MEGREMEGREMEGREMEEGDLEGSLRLLKVLRPLSTALFIVLGSLMDGQMLAAIAAYPLTLFSLQYETASLSSASFFNLNSFNTSAFAFVSGTSSFFFVVLFLKRSRTTSLILFFFTKKKLEIINYIFQYYDNLLLVIT